MNRVRAGGGVGVSSALQFSGASLYMDFTTSTYFRASSTDLAVTRAGNTAYVDDAMGTWTLVNANLPRISNKGLLVEEARTNSIRNNSMQGAAAGTPGTIPTNWQSSINSSAGLTQTIVGTGTTLGMEYIDIRAFGTTTGTSFGIY